MKRFKIAVFVHRFAFVLVANLLVLTGVAQADQPAAEEWTLLTQQSGINVYYQLGSCGPRKVMFLRFENTLDTDVKVHFHMVMPGNPPSPQIIELKARETRTGECIGTPDLLKDVAGPVVSLPPVTLKIID